VNADHDPILHATSVTCGACGTESWPADAEWITGTLVLATFAPEHDRGCSWRGFPETVLLDIGQDNTAIPALPDRPRRCRGTAISTRRQCRGYARPGSAFCASHGSVRRAA
jgi:hypothetical protein